MRRILIGLLVCAWAASGCISREVAEVEPNQNKEQFKDIPVEINRDIDILFVIDNSLSMEQEQASLANNFLRFINVLQSIEGGLPNVHIGVVSSNVGAGGFSISGCNGNGDNGRLLNVPRNSGCSPPAGTFISDICPPGANCTDPAQRTTNYSGDLAQTFACIAELGTDGCGFEQHLESMRRALNGQNSENQGFLRDNAFLAVIFLADEDDCSVSDGQMFDTSQTSVDDPLGPLDSFRCFEFGVQCEPDAPRTTGAKMECAPRTNSAYMPDVQEYVDFLKSLKDDPSKIIVAGIIGNPDPVIVSTNSDGAPALDPSCQSGAGSADPAVRLKALIDAFPNRSSVTTICNEDLSDALTVIAELLRKVIGSPCLDGNISDTNPDEAGIQPDCQVSDVRFPGRDNQTETILPQCDNPDGNAAGNHPCWIIAEDRDSCPDTPTGLTVNVYPENRTVENETHTIVRCVAD